MENKKTFYASFPVADLNLLKVKRKRTHHTQVLEQILARLPKKAIVASGKTNNTIKLVH